jgi:hypothetical protein
MVVALTGGSQRPGYEATYRRAAEAETLIKAKAEELGLEVRAGILEP